MKRQLTQEVLTFIESLKPTGKNKRIFREKNNHGSRRELSKQDLAFIESLKPARKRNVKNNRVQPHSTNQTVINCHLKDNKSESHNENLINREEPQLSDNKLDNLSDNKAVNLSIQKNLDSDWFSEENINLIVDLLESVVNPLSYAYETIADSAYIDHNGHTWYGVRETNQIPEDWKLQAKEAYDWIISVTPPQALNLALDRLENRENFELTINSILNQTTDNLSNEDYQLEDNRELSDNNLIILSDEKKPIANQSDNIRDKVSDKIRETVSDNTKGKVSDNTCTQESNEAKDKVITRSDQKDSERSSKENVPANNDLILTSEDKKVKADLSIDLSYQLIENNEDLIEAIALLEDEKIIGIDCETCNKANPEKALDPHIAKLRLVQIASYNHSTFIIDCYRCDPRLIQPLLSNDSIKIFHNAKFDLQFFLALGLEIKQRLFDTQLAYQLINAGQDNLKASLKVVAKELLDIDLSKEEQVSDWANDNLSDNQLKYAAIDASILLPLREKLREQIIAEDLGKVAKIEFDCVLAVAMMEYNGMLLDLAKWQGILKDAEKRKTELTNKLQQLLPAEVNLFNYQRSENSSDGNSNKFQLGINLDSPKQLLEALNRAGIKCTNTNSKTLKKLVTDYPQIIKPLLEYKKLSKLISSFGDSLTKKINPVTGRLHGSYWQLGSQAGRFSSSEPNLQQIPRSREARSCFVATPGYKLVIADYSQIELRIASELTDDRTMLEAYSRGEDLHKLTASIVLNKPLTEVTKEDRQIAKSANFGLCLEAGTKVVTEKGLQNIEDLTIEDIVLTHRGNWKRVTDTQKLTSKTLIEITTQSGKTIRCTPDHMMLVYFPSANGKEGGTGWVEARDLKLGRYLVYSEYEHKHPVNETVGVEKSWILGLWLAEGHKSSGLYIKQSFSANPDVYKKMKAILPKYGFTERVEKNTDFARFYLNAEKTASFIQGTFIDFDLKSRDKNLTDLIFRLTRKEKLSLLAGLWDGDGCLNKHTSKKNSVNISYVSSSESLLHNIVFLLESLAINSKIYYYPDHRANVLHIVGCRSRTKFMEIIPTVKVSRVPEYKPILKFRNEEKIISIKHLEHNDFVYDITVEDDHSFVANGLITHNCYGSSVDGFRAYAEGNYGISLSQNQAKKIMDNFFNSYRGLSKWHKQVKSRVYNHQITQTRTLANRRRLMNQPSPQQALNTPVQGTGADILKLALAKLPKALKGLDCKILATVHDEIILEAKEDIADKVAVILSDTMVKAGKEFLKRVPVEAEASIGDSWADK